MCRSGTTGSLALALGLLLAGACDGRSVGLNDDAATVPPSDAGPLPADGFAPLSDAQIPNTCGNGICDPGETALDCPQECGARSVAAGGYHSCVILADGTAACWGFNRYGQLGDGTYDNALGRRTVHGLEDQDAITVGWSHSCALGGDRAIWCWGRNKYGQLGVAGEVEETPIPLPVTGFGAAFQVSAGQHHTCAVLVDRTAWCWGANSFGQLGDSSTTERTHPVRVSGLEGVVAVHAGGEHTCALREDASVWCWGRNHRGQLGDGASIDAQIPGLVATMWGATALSTGDSHTCAVQPEGDGWCWGSNAEGQLGSDLYLQSQLPLPLGAPFQMSSLDAGDTQTCAVLVDGAVRCWGLADLSTTATSPEGLAIGGLPSAESVAVGAGHACAVATNGSLWCWGHNQHGQLGGLIAHDTQTPVLVRAQ